MRETKSCLHFALLAGALVSIAGCTPTAQTTMLGPARPPIANVELVRVYRTPPARHFERIAVVEGKSVDDLRAKAASLGADGIVPNGVVNKPGPYIGVGVGGGSYSYGRHTA